VTIYIDGELKASDIFFTDPARDKVTYSDIIILYNLAPETTCLFKDVKVCENRCTGSQMLIEAFG